MVNLLGLVLISVLIVKGDANVRLLQKTTSVFTQVKSHLHVQQKDAQWPLNKHLNNTCTCATSTSSIPPNFRRMLVGEKVISCLILSMIRIQLQMVQMLIMVMLIFFSNLWVVIVVCRISKGLIKEWRNRNVKSYYNKTTKIHNYLISCNLYRH